ncbi:hypothetical protein GGS23DRAFT_404264 [Durotheca rogersii]|uniref:uncharacterized protein n=1 Tax=Durotheca rogersii TaxID=419775 RepID=UPI00222087B8|nr:uncharacterized protein GGS23DRAFT_404264 [Durotheca rogersii]KAI5865007.1 hypothetical protein GGS23DRAFT_404264 [Durotheca rogersii]
MCFELHREFSCGHVSTELTNCPTHNKQQSSAKGIFGALLRGDLKHKKDCGRVVRHYMELKPLCHECTVGAETFVARYVGNGALKIQRPVVEEDFRRPFEKHRERRRREAQRPLEKSERERHVRHGKGDKDRTIADANPNVWIPDLYENPQRLARKEASSRAAEAAPPVSPPRLHKSSSTHQHPSRKASRKEKEASQVHEKPPKSHEHNRNHEHSRRHGSQRRAPASGNSQPQRKPAEPAPAHRRPGYGGVSGDRPPTPPVEEPPRLPPQTTQHKSRPRPPPSPSASQPAAATAGEQSDPRCAPGYTVPLPEYQVYLNALAFAREHSERNAGKAPETPRVPETPRPPATSGHRRKEKPGRMNLQGLSKALRINPPSPGSDISFVCQTSKKLSSMKDEHRPDDR